MKYAWLGCLLLAGLLSAGTQDSEFNVNSRYTVETVVVAGDGWTTTVASPADRDEKLSSGLGKEIAALIGEKLNPPILDDLARRLRRELHARTVEHRVVRGNTPDYVQVVFDVKLRPTRFDLTVPKFLYNGKQGWSGAVEGTATVRHNLFTLGLVSDSDELAERFAGIVARYDNTRLGTDKIHFGFQVESYHEQWNRNTLTELSPLQSALPTLAGQDTAGVYRTRQNFQPELTFVLAKPLTLTVGTSFERLQDQFSPSAPESADALISMLRYHRRVEDSENQHDLDGAYSLRAATRLLGSDLVYARHRWEFRYMLTRGKSVVIDDVTTGIITGRAPLFERFVLGNSSTLRGWNKYELDPLGGNRMVHNSVEYRYGAFEIFYDSGAIWDRGDTAVLRHSMGVGLRQGLFSLAVAIPIRDGHIDPIFMVGMNY
ncbi:MAG TPA: BamA/TamA family outer membrane protein [Bryobacteraceae bacterium]|nr:BamA/TamA family outer membrane protein [Bryobacteraceae bacterium]